MPYAIENSYCYGYGKFSQLLFILGFTYLSSPIKNRHEFLKESLLTSSSPRIYYLFLLPASTFMKPFYHGSLLHMYKTSSLVLTLFTPSFHKLTGVVVHQLSHPEQNMPTYACTYGRSCYLPQMIVLNQVRYILFKDSMSYRTLLRRSSCSHPTGLHRRPC